MPKRGILSENLKQEIAKELGVYEIVQKSGWGAVSSRDRGKIDPPPNESTDRSFGR